jgi:hypothetical protein
MHHLLGIVGNPLDLPRLQVTLGRGFDEQDLSLLLLASFVDRFNVPIPTKTNPRWEAAS